MGISQSVSSSLNAGSGGGGVSLGDWNALTNTPTLPNPPTAPDYAVGEYYTITTAGTQFGYTFAVGDRIVVAPDAGDLAWNKQTYISPGTQPWTISGSNIYYTTGFVGIGSANPATSLYVNGVLNGWTAFSCGIDDGVTARVVAGNYLTKATIGGHNGALNAWATIAINPGGNTEIGTSGAASTTTIGGTLFAPTIKGSGGGGSNIAIGDVAGGTTINGNVLMTTINAAGGTLSVTGQLTVTGALTTANNLRAPIINATGATIFGNVSSIMTLAGSSITLQGNTQVVSGDFTAASINTTGLTTIGNGGNQMTLIADPLFVNGNVQVDGTLNYQYGLVDVTVSSALSPVQLTYAQSGSVCLGNTIAGSFINLPAIQPSSNPFFKFQTRYLTGTTIYATGGATIVDIGNLGAVSSVNGNISNAAANTWVTLMAIGNNWFVQGTTSAVVGGWVFA